MPVVESIPRPKAIVHLGAGRCNELDAYLACEPERIILVEANPDLAASLRRRTAREQNVEVFSAAIAPSSGKTVLKVFNHPSFSSLRLPTGLYELFPGLRLDREVVVDAITAVGLLERCGLQSEQGNWLIVDVPGEESSILEALRGSHSLPAFDRIVLHCGKATLFEGNDDAATVLQRLHGEGYEIDECDEDMDPDRPRWTLHRNRNVPKVENRELQRRLEEYEERLQQANEQAKEYRAQVERLGGERDEQAKLAGERQTELETLQQAKDEAEKRAEAQIARLTKERKEQAKLSQEHQARIADLEAQLAELEKRHSLTKEEILRAEGQIDVIKDLLLRDPGL